MKIATCEYNHLNFISDETPNECYWFLAYPLHAYNNLNYTPRGTIRFDFL